MVESVAQMDKDQTPTCNSQFKKPSQRKKMQIGSKSAMNSGFDDDQVMSKLES